MTQCKSQRAYVALVMWAKWLEWKLLGTRAAGRGGTNCSRKIEFTHPRYIYIYGYRIFFSFFFLIRREIGQIKIRSEVRVALEFTRFLVTRGSSVLTRDRIIFSLFHVDGKFFSFDFFPWNCKPRVELLLFLSFLSGYKNILVCFYG